MVFGRGFSAPSSTRRRIARASASVMGEGLSAAAHLDHFLGGHEDLAELLLHPKALHTLLQRVGHLVLEAGIGVHHVPAFCHEPYP